MESTPESTTQTKVTNGAVERMRDSFEYKKQYALGSIRSDLIEFLQGSKSAHMTPKDRLDSLKLVMDEKLGAKEKRTRAPTARQAFPEQWQEWLDNEQDDWMQKSFRLQLNELASVPSREVRVEDQDDSEPESVFKREAANGFDDAGPKCIRRSALEARKHLQESDTEEEG